MKKKIIPVGLGVLIAIGALFPEHSYSQNAKGKTQNAEVKDSIVVNKKEEKVDRNVMQNAGASTGPRQLNIGLPFLGDILILENDIPVVYTFYPEIPTTCWNYNNSIGRIGLLSFAEGALTYGKVGYCVNSYDREASSKFKGYASAYTNSFGSFRYDACITGPIGNKGWGYTLSAYENYDRGNGNNLMYTPYFDRAEEIKAGISKKYKKGSIRLLWKHTEDRPTFMTTQPIQYLGDGKTAPISNFSLGTDSYILADGKVPYYDYNTGKAKMGDMASDAASKFKSDAIYLNGEHKFNNGMKLTYSSMYKKSLAPFTDQFPISLMVQDNDQRDAAEVYTYAGTTNKYNGSVQLVNNLYVPQSPISTWISRVELAKKMNNHNVRVGITQQNFNMSMVTQGGLYYQTVEKNPKLLDRYQDLSAYGMGLYPVTKGSLLPTTGTGSYQKLDIHKLAFYFSDDMDLTPWLSAGIGGRIEKQDDRETHDQYENQFVLDRPLITQDFNNKFNKVGIASVVVKATKNFGFLGDVTYNDWYNRFWDYPENQKDALGNPVTGALSSIAKDKQLVVLNMGAGIYYNNGNLISLVSKITRISKSNIVTNLGITNPANTQENRNFYPLFYDISTIGWSTDIISSPVKNLNLHLLVTLQKPQYKNYSVSAFGVTYDYNDKIVPGLSQFLGEFDANYNLTSSLSVFANLRYFGKQYGNMTNSIYYNGWFENFGGVTYTVSRNLNFKLQVVNFLDQRGISGTLQGADQIVDAAPFVNRTLNASAIRPRTVEFTANFKF